MGEAMNDKEKGKITDKIKNRQKSELVLKKLKGLLAKKVTVFVIAGTAILVVLGGMIGSDIAGRGKKAQIITTATLEQIIDVDELSTYEALYNGICTVMNEKKKEKADYHVYYEAKVKAGIDFEKVEISIDQDTKNIKVDIPEIKITSADVDITSLDFIFENNKANDATVSEEAYRKCKEDVKQESSKDEAIYRLAEQNAENIIKALINPFVSQLDSEYTLEII